MELFLTHACNLHCTYCYNGAPFARAMPQDVMERAVDLAFREGAGPVDIAFFGGEPLLAFDSIVAAVERCDAASRDTGRPVRYRMTTNGTLLSGMRADFVVGRRFRVAISLDGPADVHDRARPFAGGSGSHAVVVANLRALLPRMPDLPVITVVGPSQAARVRACFDHVTSLGVRRHHLALDYNAAWDDAAVAALAISLGEVADAVADTYRAGRPVSVPILDAKIARHVLHRLVRITRCACGRGQFVVAPSGRMYPCDRMVGADDGTGCVIGHIDTGFDSAARARFLGCHDGTPVRCRTCAIAHRCSFGGSCIRWALTGRIDAFPEGLCRLEEVLIAAADRLAEPLFAEGNATFRRRFYGSPDALSALACRGLDPDGLFDETDRAGEGPANLVTS